MEGPEIQEGDRVTRLAGSHCTGEVVSVWPTMIARTERFSRPRQMAKVRWEQGGYTVEYVSCLRKLY